MAIRETADQVTEWVALLREHVPAQSLPDPHWLAGILLVAGVLLSVWGAKLLRGGFVLSFVAIGAAVGIRLAESQQIDMLIGLVLGAGLAGLMGHLMYRWWLGTSAGAFAVLLVLAVGVPRAWPGEVERYRAQQQTLTLEQYRDALQGDMTSTAPSFAELREYLWTERRDLSVKTLVICGLAFGLGFIAGLMIPRLTTIVGTAAAGTLALIVGGGILITLHRPDAWDTLDAQSGWVLAGITATFAMSVLMQGARSRPVLAAPVDAAAVAA